MPSIGAPLRKTAKENGEVLRRRVMRHIVATSKTINRSYNVRGKLECSLHGDRTVVVDRSLRKSTSLPHEVEPERSLYPHRGEIVDLPRWLLVVPCLCILVDTRERTSPREGIYEGINERRRDLNDASRLAKRTRRHSLLEPVLLLFHFFVVVVFFFNTNLMARVAEPSRASSS